MRRQIRITFSRETRASMRKVRCSSRAALSPPFPVRHRRHSRNAKIRSTLYRAPLFTVRDERIAPSYHQGQPLEPTRGLTSISPTIRFEPAQLRKSSVQTPESSPSFHRSRQARRIPFAPSKGCQRNPRANWRASLQRQGSDPHKRESPAYRLPNQAPSFHRSRQARHIPFAPSEAIIADLAHKLAGVSPMKRLISA